MTDDEHFATHIHSCNHLPINFMLLFLKNSEHLCLDVLCSGNSRFFYAVYPQILDHMNDTLIGNYGILAKKLWYS